MTSNRFQTVQLVLSVMIVGLLLVSLGISRSPTPVNAAELQAGLAAPVPGGPGYVMIPATAFSPERPTDNYTVFWGELSVPTGSPNGYTFFNAPVNLPQGATLTGMTMYYRDTNSDSLTLGGDLMRKPLPSVSSGELVGLSTYSNLIGQDVFQSDTTPDPTRAVIDNSQYAYWLNLYIYSAPSYLQLKAIRIDYTYTISMPLINR